MQKDYSFVVVITYYYLLKHVGKLHLSGPGCDPNFPVLSLVKLILI